MGTRPEKRGPRIGDAASLWNFTPSPGWTKDEVQVLKLCLMKHGVGQWLQILNSGLLPGKLIQQLNGQTQRLLGQQSLAAFTGLRVDIDRIRADNEAKTDAQRKNGLIIWSGPNPTKDMKQQWQREAKEKYGLAAEQLKEVDEQLEELAAHRCPAAAPAAVADAPEPCSMPASVLYEIDPAQIPREQKLEVLCHLHQRLNHLQAWAAQQQVATAAVSASHLRQLQEARQRPQLAKQHKRGREASTRPPMAAKVQAAGDCSDDFKENRAADANTPSASPEDLPQPSKRGKLSSGSGSRARQGGGAVKRGAAARGTSDDALVGAAAEPRRAASGRQKRRAARSEVYEYGLDSSDSDFEEGPPPRGVQEADVSHLEAMGFPAAKAKTALRASGYDLERAAEWLLVNCC